MKRIVSWKILSSLGQSKLVKSSYIWMIVIPIFAKILEKVDPQIQLYIFGELFHINFTLPFSWKIFYFSSLFFAAGTIIYQIFCPRIIKEYPTYNDFIAAKQSSKYIVVEACNILDYPKRFTPKELPADQHLIRLLAEYRKFTNRDGHQDLSELMKSKTENHDIHYLSFTALSKIEGEAPHEERIRRELRAFSYMMNNLKLDEDSERHGFWFVWGISNEWNPWSQRACLACYYIAFLLLTVVLVQNIQSVWSA
jgi:hypothetical protein